MSSSSPAELNAAAVIQLIDSGAYPREVVMTLARGFLPLPQDDLITILAHLTVYGDEEISSTARSSLVDIPTRTVAAFASNEEMNPEYLLLLTRATSDTFILQSLIRNRAVSDESVEQLAREAEAAVQDVIVINQARILRSPSILDALLENPKLTPDIRRRALEVREEFFDKVERVRELREAEAEEDVDIPLDAIADLLEAAENEPQPETPPPDLAPSEKGDEKAESLWTRVINMKVADKVKLAFRGDKSARTMLIRDRNRLVCSAAIRNPRITETEVEGFAASRNVDEEVLRIIGMRRDWMSKYAVMIALCRNPRAPLSVVLPLINRLTLRDLKGLKDDRGVPDVVRQSARKLFDTRAKKT